MCPAYVTHRGVSTRFADTDHSLVIFLESQLVRLGVQRIHKLKCRNAFGAETESTRDDFGLWRAMTNRGLLFGDTYDRKLSRDT